MNRWPPAHVRLLLRSSAFAITATWGVLTGFALIGALLDQVDDFGQGDYGLAQALLCCCCRCRAGSTRTSRWRR